MSLQAVFTFTYIPFVVFAAMSCLYEGRKAKILKILSAVLISIASVSYIFFIKSLL
tara:strand:- start:325 stop:492 length:168 start_codon:yes stop_codon:yes gene_type:complete